MPTVQKSIRVQEKTLKEIEQIARDAGKEFSVVANELLDEAVRMQRCPGIVFTEGTTEQDEGRGLQAQALRSGRLLQHTKVLMKTLTARKRLTTGSQGSR